jgi:hypothetical protein
VCRKREREETLQARRHHQFFNFFHRGFSSLTDSGDHAHSEAGSVCQRLRVEPVSPIVSQICTIKQSIDTDLSTHNYFEFSSWIPEHWRLFIIVHNIMILTVRTEFMGTEQTFSLSYF